MKDHRKERAEARKKAEKPSISVKLRYFVLEPKISGGFNNGVKKSVSYRPARNS